MHPRRGGTTVSKQEGELRRVELQKQEDELRRVELQKQEGELRRVELHLCELFLISEPSTVSKNILERGNCMLMALLLPSLKLTLRT